MQTITVTTKDKKYPIFIGANLLDRPDLLISHLCGKQILLVTNETIAPLYLSKIKQLLSQFQCDEVILPDGEQFKDLAHLNRIFDILLEKHHHRQTTLIALGGGVIGDMTGFAAACYQRGVNFIQVPTTLLAQVDASVGGKTAVNHSLGKNMIGAFYQPSSVVIDVNFLSTLPSREFNAGIAEIIKHSLIADPSFFEWLEEHLADVLNRDQEALQYAIYRCCEIKSSIVSIDEKESGVRAILNFGHTVGHAIEACLGYGVLLHGEAVAIGMCIASELSAMLGYLNAIDVARIESCLLKAKLPTKMTQVMTLSQCKQWMTVDKKAVNNTIRFILLKKIGEAIIVEKIEEKILESALIKWGFKI